MTSVQTRIDRARWWALTEQPFYGSLAMSLADVIDSSIDTAATDGKCIRWSPEFVESLSDAELRFVLLHETLHCAHQHLWRLPIDEKGNIAGDHEINLTLAAIDGIEMPEGGLADPQYRDMSCEDILGLLGKDDEDEGDQGGGSDGSDEGDPQQGNGPSKQQDQSKDGQQQQDSGSGKPSKDGQQQQDSGGNGQPQSGGGKPKPGGGGKPGKPDPCGSFMEPAADAVAGESAESMRDDWDSRVVQAAQAAQALGAGDIPADIQRILDNVRHQEIDWRREMADFVKDSMSTRNDWSRAARRHAWQAVIYPRRVTDSVGTVIFARDTSGSINDKLCAEFSAMVTDCVAEMGCKGIVIDCDTRIQAEYEISDYEPCPLTAKGGGGTKFQPVFDRAEELIAMGEQIAGIVYLTDLWGPAPDESEIATLWISTSNRPAPFGRVVEVDIKGW